MLLRRITKHVKEQNWFAVGLDFLIVVVGVFIGIQVSNWNAAINEKDRGEKIKERLVAEFIEIEAELIRYVDDVTEWVEIANQLAEDILEDKIERDTQEFSQRLDAIRWRRNSGGSNTIAEIISQGDMDILDSPDLVEKLWRFETLAERHSSNNLSLGQQVSHDRNAMYKASYLAAIPIEKRSDGFLQKLQVSTYAPDIYLSTVNVSRALQIDLRWYQESLNRACAVLEALNEKCDSAE